MGVPRMEKQDLREKLDTGEAIVTVDARCEPSWQESDVRLPGAIRISPDNIDDITRVGDANAIVVYGSGADGDAIETVAKRLMTAGRLNVSILNGGFDEWQANNYPLENKSSEADVREA